MFELVIFWIIFAGVVAFAAAARGRSAFGWLLLALVISPLLALILVLVLPNLSATARAAAASIPSPSTHIKCPDCAELILIDARVCKHCRCRLVPPGTATAQSPAQQ